VPTVAIIGASADRSKFGNKAVRAYAARGDTVFPVHPRESAIEGLPTYRSVLDLPAEHVDLVSIYLPPTTTLSILDEVAKISVDQVLLNPGAESPEVLARARELKLPVLVACSIIAAGYSPSEFES
jgi:predicted CoA-binding protein